MFVYESVRVLDGSKMELGMRGALILFQHGYVRKLINCALDGISSLVHLHGTVFRCNKMGIPPFGYNTHVFLPHCPRVCH